MGLYGTFLPQDGQEDQDDQENTDDINDDLLRRLYEANPCEYIEIKSMKTKCKLGEKFVLRKVSH